MSTSESNSIPKWQVIAGWVLSCLPLLAFLPSAFFKIAQPTGFLETWVEDYPAAAARPLGIIELSCVALYFVPRTRVLGAILTTAYLGGAVATHVRKGEPTFVVVVLIGIMLWGGLFLRMPRVRALLPLVK